VSIRNRLDALEALMPRGQPVASPADLAEKVARILDSADRPDASQETRQIAERVHELVQRGADRLERWERRAEPWRNEGEL
jgi:hypothetical protein